MASNDDNKRKYSADGTEQEAEEAPSKKQKIIGDDDHGDDNDDEGDDHGDDGDDDGDSSSSSSSSIDDDYLSESEVYSKEEMNIPTGSEERLLI
jgi:hypothetical protein